MLRLDEVGLGEAPLFVRLAVAAGAVVVAELVGRVPGRWMPERDDDDEVT